MTALMRYVFLQPQAPEDLDILHKTPTDSIQVEFDFKNSIDLNPYNLSSATVKAFDSDGTDVSTDMVGTVTVTALSGKVEAVIKGGESGKKYIIIVDAVTSENPKIRGALKLKVKDYKP